MKRGIVGNLIGLMVALIILLAVLLPVTNTQLQSTAANLSGFTSANTVAQLFPLLLVVAGVTFIVSLYAFGRQ